MDLIIIHGAPGTGKTTVSQRIHELLRSPWFEFGWIPEFRQKNSHLMISYDEEEEISFENLVLVCKNYLKHGYENIIISDLRDCKVAEIPNVFKDNDYVIVTLYSNDDEILKNRILKRNNGNDFRDFDRALQINSMIKKRDSFNKEHRIDITNLSVSEIVGLIQAMLKY